MYLIVSLINRSLLHAYFTGVLFIIFNRLFGISVVAFSLMILIVVGIAEYHDHRTNNFNYPNDWFSAARDCFINIALIIFFTAFLIKVNELSSQQKLTALGVSALVSYVLVFLIDKLPSFFKITSAKGRKHWEAKHFLDLASNLVGPFIVSPFLVTLLSI